MPNPNSPKGAAWELALTSFLNRRGVGASRRKQDSWQDKGDIVLTDPALSDFTLEAKWHNKYDFPNFVKQAEKAARTAGVPFGVAAVRKHGDTDPANSFAVMSIDTFTELLLEIKALNDRIEELEYDQAG